MAITFRALRTNQSDGLDGSCFDSFTRYIRFHALVGTLAPDFSSTRRNRADIAEVNLVQVAKYQISEGKMYIRNGSEAAVSMSVRQGLPLGAKAGMIR